MTEERDIEEMAEMKGISPEHERQRSLFVEELLAEAEQGKAIREQYSKLSFSEIRAELISVRDRQGEWLKRIYEQARLGGKAGEDLSSYILERMRDPDEGNIDLKKRESYLLTALIQKTSELVIQIGKEPDEDKQIQGLIEVFGLRLLNRARFKAERVALMDQRGLIIRDPRPVLDKKQKPQDLYMTEPTVIPRDGEDTMETVIYTHKNKHTGEIKAREEVREVKARKNPTLELIRKLYGRIVEALQGAPKPEKERHPLLLTADKAEAAIFIPKQKHKGDEDFTPGLYLKQEEVQSLLFEGGKVYEKPEDGTRPRLVATFKDWETSAEIYQADEDFLKKICSATILFGVWLGGFQWAFKIPQLMDYLGINYRGKDWKGKDMRERVERKFRSFEKAFAVFPDMQKSKYDVLHVAAFEWDNMRVTLSMAFLKVHSERSASAVRARLQKQIEMKKGKAKKEAEAKLKSIVKDPRPDGLDRTGYHSLAYSTLGSRKDTEAKRIVGALLLQLVTAGLEPKKKVEKTGEIKPRETILKRGTKKLIEESPALTKRLEEAKNDEVKRQILRDIFENVYKYLKEDTKVYEILKGFELQEVFPAPSKLDNKIREKTIVMKHWGLSPGKGKELH